MPIAITEGLFRLGFTDYYAILGVPIGADAQMIRQGYLAIARRLHPDSCPTADAATREWTTALFSKLASPAYQKLSIERNRREYDLTLKFKATQAVEEQISLKSLGPLAQRVAASNDLEAAYLDTVGAIAPQLYADPLVAPTRISELSAINLAYLLRRRGQLPVPGSVSLTSLSPISGAVGSAIAPPPPTPDPVRNSEATAPEGSNNRAAMVSAYLRRAQEYLEKGVYAQATQELRDALRIAPDNSRCHSLQGLVYIRQNQPTMAKVHVRKALTLDANNPEALEGRRLLEQMGHKIDLTPTTGVTPASKEPPPKGGLLSGLFGGKRK
jgi:tetratricopeptide (TPR) repeat protein